MINGLSAIKVCTFSYIFVDISIREFSLTCFSVLICTFACGVIIQVKETAYCEYNTPNDTNVYHNFVFRSYAINILK